MSKLKGSPLLFQKLFSNQKFNYIVFSLVVLLSYQNCGRFEVGDSLTSVDESSSSLSETVPPTEPVQSKRVFSITYPTESNTLPPTGFTLKGTCNVENSEIRFEGLPIGPTTCQNGVWESERYEGPILGMHDVEIKAMVIQNGSTVDTVSSKSYVTLGRTCEMLEQKTINYGISAFNGKDFLVVVQNYFRLPNPVYRFNYKSNTWTEMQKTPYNFSSAKLAPIDANRFFVVTWAEGIPEDGGTGLTKSGLRALIFDISENVWTDVTGDLAQFAMARTSAPSSLTLAGNKFILFGSSFANTSSSPGAVYDIANQKWIEMSKENAPTSNRQQFSAFWTGSKFVVWGGNSKKGVSGLSTEPLGSFAYGEYLADGGLYDPEKDTWEKFETPMEIQGRTLHGSVWTGTEMIIWGGLTSDYSCNTPNYTNSCSNVAAAFNPQTKSWRILSSPPGNAGFYFSSVAASDHKIYFFGGAKAMFQNSLTYSNDIYSYDLASDKWTVINSPAMTCGRVFLNNPNGMTSSVFEVEKKKFIRFTYSSEGNGNWVAYGFQL